MPVGDILNRYALPLRHREWNTGMVFPISRVFTPFSGGFLDGFPWQSHFYYNWRAGVVVID